MSGKQLAMMIAGCIVLILFVLYPVPPLPSHNAQ
jgi:hypothetical protein